MACRAAGSVHQDAGLPSRNKPAFGRVWSLHFRAIATVSGTNISRGRRIGLTQRHRAQILATRPPR